ncbi:MAG: glycosyltransferase family 9 protein [Candidatus Kaelpia aquatica]|nr:glycosyltransferase family 9 protein [Candidatus Kaelpia aquatica]
MDKILVVNSNWLGDVLFSIPALRAIKHGGEKQVYLATMLPGRCKRMLEHNPLIEEIIEFDERNSHKGLNAKIETIRYIHRGGFQKAIFLHRSLTKLSLTVFSRVPERAGYHRKKTSLLLTDKITAVAKDSLHKAQYFLNLAEALGYKECGLEYDFYVAPKEFKEASALLEARNINPLADKIITIHPGANWAPKQWPIKSYIEFIRIAFNYNSQIKIVIIGNEQEIHLGCEIEQAFSSNHNNIINLTGLTTLGTLGGALLFSDILISGDSGPLHIGCALKPLSGIQKYKIPFCVGLYGATDPRLTGPLSGKYQVLQGERHKDCSLPCYNFNCTNYSCIDSISPERVMQVVKQALSS